MKNTGKFLAAASVLALGLSLATGAVAEDAKVKCATGKVAAGKNDCATSSHSCAGQAKADNVADEWVHKTKAECEKEGGKVVADKEEKKG